MPDRIELLEGSARWLNLVQLLIFLATGFFILTASTPWLWKLGATVALLIFYALAIHRSAQRTARNSLLLRLDGSIRLSSNTYEVDGQLVGGAWVSRWICVLHWAELESGSWKHSIVCATENRACDYRRLMVWLRLGIGDKREVASW